MSGYTENRYWNIDRKLKNKKLREFIFSQHKIGYTITMTICVMLDIIGTFLFLSSIIIFCGAEELDGKIVGTLAGSIFLFIFVIISEFIRNKAIKGRCRVCLS